MESGIHTCNWPEFHKRFGINPHRLTLLNGMKDALDSLKNGGCTAVYIDGSFVTAKDIPNDYDAIWEVDGVEPTVIDPVFFDFSDGRMSQKMKYQGEFFPSHMLEGKSNSTFLNFFQTDKETGDQKGIVKIDLRRLN